MQNLLRYTRAHHGYKPPDRLCNHTVTYRPAPDGEDGGPGVAQYAVERGSAPRVRDVVRARRGMTHRARTMATAYFHSQVIPLLSRSSFSR